MYGIEHVEESLLDLENNFPGQKIRPPRGRIIRPLKAKAAKDQAGANCFSICPSDQEKVQPIPGDFSCAELGVDGFCIRPPDEENFQDIQGTSYAQS
jgi:hypothetical protein